MGPLIRTEWLELRPAEISYRDALIDGIGQIFMSPLLTRMPDPETSAHAEMFLHEQEPSFPSHAFIFHNYALIETQLGHRSWEARA